MDTVLYTVRRFALDRSGRVRLLRVALVLVALLAASCGSTSNDTPSGQEGSAIGTVRVASLRQPHLFHPNFYDRFAPEGMTVEVVPLANSTDIKNAVVSGSVDFGVTGITASIQGASRDEPVVVVASAADGGSGIVARAGIETVADLAGAKIGYVPGAAQDILLRLTLSAAGLDPDADVELVKVGFADMADQLQRGDIDAFSGAEVGPSVALLNGAKLVSRPYDTPMGRINIVMITRQAIIDENPDLVQSMVQIHAEATEYMRTNKDEWAEAVIDEYGFSADQLDLAIPNIDLRWGIDDEYIAQAAVLGGQNVLLDQIDKEPDYERFFDTTFVEGVDI